MVKHIVFAIKPNKWNYFYGHFFSFFRSSLDCVSKRMEPNRMELRNQNGARIWYFSWLENQVNDILFFYDIFIKLWTNDNKSHPNTTKHVNPFETVISFTSFYYSAVMWSDNKLNIGFDESDFMFNVCRHHFIYRREIARWCFFILLQFCIRWKRVAKCHFLYVLLHQQHHHTNRYRHEIEHIESMNSFFTHHFQYKINDAKTLKPVGETAKWHMAYYHWFYCCRQSCNFTTMKTTIDCEWTNIIISVKQDRKSVKHRKNSSLCNQKLCNQFYTSLYSSV